MSCRSAVALLLLLLAACCLCQVDAAAKADPQSVLDPNVKFLYVGCYIDGKQRDLPTVVRMRRLTAENCYRQCSAMGYRYFGLQQGRHCHCGNKFGMYGERPDEECRHRCHGNRAEYCGGKYRNAVYEIDVETECVDEIIDHREYTYLGCYGDYKKRRDLTNLVDRRDMTVRKCYTQCKRMRYKYFGLQNGKYCFCGNKYGLYGRRSEKYCSRRCQRNKYEYCGGKYQNSIYKISPPLCDSLPSDQKKP